jgi:hypothetical protein
MRVGFHSSEQKAFTRHHGRLPLLAVVVCALVPSLAPAANINFIDLTDTLSVAGTQFEGGFTSAINQETITFQGSWISNGGTNGAGIVYLVDPGTTVVSDILRLTFQCASATGCMASTTGTFISDITGNLGTLPAGFNGVAETGALQNVTSLLQDPATGASVTLPANLTIFVQSDINESGDVPEPSFFYLVLGGVVLMGGRIVRRRAA